MVGIALSGTEAIEIIENNRPDLMLMDIMLQEGMDGIEAASIIGERFGVPAVYLTANSDPSTVERIRSTNSYGYLLKPYKDRELQVAVETAVYRHRNEVRRRVLYKLRDIVWQMQAAEDVERLLRALGQSMVELNIPFQASSLNLLSPIPNPTRIHFYHIHRDNQYEDHDGRDLSHVMKHIWSTGEIAYRRDLEAEDLYDERAQLPRGNQVRRVLDVPFSHGNLGRQQQRAECLYRRSYRNPIRNG
ncbi:MAG: CheY-like chemotaxis protein [Candidatus Latescibacterota bacterium]